MTISVDIRQAVNPQDAAHRDTNGLRRDFLVTDLFQSGKISLAYSHLDRVIIGGIVPLNSELHLDRVKETGTDSFLDRREAAIMNIGGDAVIATAGATHRLRSLDALYIGMGQGALTFASADPANPAQLYLISAPAHRSYPTVPIFSNMAKEIRLGTAEEANARTICQYVHPDVCQSCQLLVGMTKFEPGSVWNTMPAHRHDCRMEVYLYFGMDPQTRVFHFMGEPHETRHVVMKNQEAIFSPGWSIHAGAGTGRYSFIWAMAGDNMNFADMEMVPMDELR